MKQTVAAITSSLMLTALAQAQSPLTGKWEETTSSGLQIQLSLAETKQTLTGTFTVRGRALTITDGQVSKNTFTFKAKLEAEPEGFSGVLSGDEITLWRDRNGKGDAVLLRRVRPVLTGKWRGQTPAGTEVVLDLNAKAETLTGTLVREGVSVPITDGKVTASTFSFKAMLGDQPESFTGRFDGDEDGIRVWLDRQGPDRAAVLKRVTK